MFRIRHLHRKRLIRICPSFLTNAAACHEVIFPNDDQEQGQAMPP